MDSILPEISENVLTSPEPRRHLQCPALKRWQGSPDPKGTFWRRRDALPS